MLNKSIRLQKNDLISIIIFFYNPKDILGEEDDDGLLVAEPTLNAWSQQEVMMIDQNNKYVLT